jgi:hypothetical protein
MSNGSLINIVATINATRGSGKIRYVNPVERAALPAPAADSPVAVRLLRDDNSISKEQAVQVKWDTCTRPGDDRTGIADVALPLDAGVRTVELVVNGNVVDKYQSALPAADPNAGKLMGVAPSGAAIPAVANIRPDRTTPDTVYFRWDAAGQLLGAALGPAAATGAATPGLHYNVQISTDQGISWQTIAVSRRRAEVAIDRGQLLGAGSVQVRVIATDGFRSTVHVSPAFDPTKL